VREVPRLPVVSAEELLWVVEVHLDRVHDAVRRLGCDPQAAAEVVETSALDLVDAVAERPQTVTDAVGWWLHAARRLGLRVGRTAAHVPDPLPVGGGLLSADDDQLVLSEALEELGERDRAALLLRDSHDLPMASVAVALGTDQATATELVGRARLAFLSRADEEPAAPVPAHAGSLATLARLADDGPPAREDAPARRHAGACGECGAVVEAQRRAHLLLAGLTVVTLPPEERAAVLARVEQHAVAVLPATASLLAVQDEEWDDEDDLRDRWFSPVLAALGIVLAVLTGIAVGVAADRLDAPRVDQRTAAADVLPRVTAPPVRSPAPGTIRTRAPEPTPPPRVFEIPSPTPTPPPAPPPPAEPTLLVEPRSGPNGALLTVRGTGWAPGGQVELSYLRADGTPTGSVTTASADERGVFQATLPAADPDGTPGRHVVRADDGTSSATAPYDAVD
jgi:DNA-directed RNA polymerase specialized sigma24 family protein